MARAKKAFSCQIAKPAWTRFTAIRTCRPCQHRKHCASRTSYTANVAGASPGLGQTSPGRSLPPGLRGQEEGRARDGPCHGGPQVPRLQQLSPARRARVDARVLRRGGGGRPETPEYVSGHVPSARAVSCGHENVHGEPFTSLSIPMAESVEKGMGRLLEDCQVRIDVRRVQGAVGGHQAHDHIRVPALPDRPLEAVPQQRGQGERSCSANVGWVRVDRVHQPPGDALRRAPHGVHEARGVCYMCNDASVFPIEEKHMAKAAEAAYVLVYVRDAVRLSKLRQ